MSYSWLVCVHFNSGHYGSGIPRISQMDAKGGAKGGPEGAKGGPGGQV